MKHIKLFETFCLVENHQNLDQYVSNVVKELLSKFDDKTKKYAGLDEKSMHNMISGHENQYKEYEINYPDHFDQTVEDMWEYDKSVEDAVEYFYDGVRALVNGTLKAM